MLHNSKLVFVFWFVLFQFCPRFQQSSLQLFKYRYNIGCFMIIVTSLVIGDMPY